MKWKAHFARVVLILGIVFVAVPAAVFIGVAWATDYPILKPGASATRLVQGAYHVHSTASDGRGTPQQIAEAASRAGLQFVLLTDHNVEVLQPPEFVNGVLLIPAVELSTPQGHVVALHLARPLTKAERDRDAIQNISSLGGVSFLAHPAQKKRPWTDWEMARQATGLELYSMDSSFRDAQRRPLSSLVPAILSYAGNERHGIVSVVAEQPELLERLLNLDDRRAKVALCAHDAHGWPSYESEFRTLAMALPMGAKLPSDAREAAELVISSLASGRSHCVFRAIGESDGFEIEGLDPARSAAVGTRLRISLPAWAPPDAQIRIHGPARLMPDGRSILLDAAGALQLEVWVRVPHLFWTNSWRPWLVPSPIWVRS